MKIHCYVRRQWRLLKITSIVIPWKVERIFLPFLILRVQILHFLRDNMFSCKHESCLKRLIWKELLILSILLRTCRSKRLALNPHLDFTDDREVHLRRKRCLTRDPREDVHCFAVQQRFILIQLITRQTIDLLLKAQKTILRSPSTTFPKGDQLQAFLVDESDEWDAYATLHPIVTRVSCTLPLSPFHSVAGCLRGIPWACRSNPFGAPHLA